jgi:hypothetical protein
MMIPDTMQTAPIPLPEPGTTTSVAPIPTVVPGTPVYQSIDKTGARTLWYSSLRSGRQHPRLTIEPLGLSSC